MRGNVFNVTYCISGDCSVKSIFFYFSSLCQQLNDAATLPLKIVVLIQV